MAKVLINNMTSGSVSKELLRFAMPIMLSNLLQTLYNMVDMIIVGQCIGNVGMSAISVGTDILHMATLISMGVGNAGQVLIAQYVGIDDRKSVVNMISSMFAVMICGALLFTGFFTLFGDRILTLLNTPADCYRETRAYTMTCCAGMIFIYGYSMVGSVLRGIGDSKHPLLFVAVAAAANVVLDLLFVAVLDMGVFGAAFATVLSQALSFALAMAFLLKNRGMFGIDFNAKDIKPQRSKLLQILKLGFPMALQSAAISIASLFVNSYIYAYGSVATSVTGVGNKLATTITIVTMALSSAGSIIIGQNISAGKHKRVLKVLGVTLSVNCAVALSLCVLLYSFPEAIFGLFTSDEQVLEMGLSYLPCAILSIAVAALRSPAMALINGVGMPRLNIMAGLLDGIVCRVGFAMLLGLYFRMGIHGFWYGNVVAGIAPFVVGFIFLVSGKWRKTKLLIDTSV